MSFSLKDFFTFDLKSAQTDICSEEEFLYDTNNPEDISYNFFLFNHSLKKYSNHVYLTSTCNQHYTSILYLHQNEKSLILLILKNLINSTNDNLTYKTICVFKFDRLELETTDQDDLQNINHNINNKANIEQYDLFFVCDNYILLQCVKKKIILVDFILKKYSVLYINTETKRSIKVVSTYDEVIIPQSNVKGTSKLLRHKSITRSYVFCISNRQLYFFILNHNAINNTQYVLHYFPFEELYDSINEFQIQRIDRKDEGKWFYLIVLLIDGKLIRYITNFVSCSMKGILLNFHKMIKTKQISRNVNTFNKSDECHVKIIHSLNLLSFIILQVGKNDYYGFKYYNTDSPEELRKRFISADSDFSYSLNNTKSNITNTPTAKAEESPIQMETPNSNNERSDTAIFHQKIINTISSPPFNKGNITSTSIYSDSNKSSSNINFIAKEKEVIYYNYSPDNEQNQKNEDNNYYNDDKDNSSSKTENEIDYQENILLNKIDSKYINNHIVSFTYYNLCIFKRYNNKIALYSFPLNPENNIIKSRQLYKYAFAKSDLKLYNIFHYPSLNSSFLLTNKYILKIRYNDRIHSLLHRSLHSGYSLSSSNEDLYSKIKNILKYEHSSKTKYICKLCLKPKANVQCEECKKVYYCSKEHQLMDYKSFHFCECEIYKYLFYLEETFKKKMTQNNSNCYSINNENEINENDDKYKKHSISLDKLNKIIITICGIINKILEYTNDNKDYKEYLMFIKITLNLLRVVKVENFLNKNFSRYQKAVIPQNNINILFKRVFNMELWFFYINLNTLYLNYALSSKLHILSTYLLQNSKLYDIYLKKVENKKSSNFNYFGFSASLNCVDISYRKNEINQLQKNSSFFFDLCSIYVHHNTLNIYEKFILYHIRSLSSFVKIALRLHEKTKNCKIQNYLAMNILPFIPMIFEEKINTENINLPTLNKQGQLNTNNVFKNNQMQLPYYFIDGNYEEFFPHLVLSYCYFKLCFILVKLNKISTVIKILTYIFTFIQQLSELNITDKINPLFKIKILVNSAILLSFIGNFSRSIHNLEQANYLCFQQKLTLNILLKIQSLLILNYINIHRFDTAYILAKQAIDLNKTYFNRIQEINCIYMNDNTEDNNNEMNAPKKDGMDINNNISYPKITLKEYMNYIKLKGYLLFTIEFMGYLYNKVNYKAYQYRTNVPIKTQNNSLYYEFPLENKIYMTQDNIIHKEINIYNRIQYDILENDGEIENQKINHKLRYLSYKYPNPFTNPEMNIGSKLLHQYMISSEKNVLNHDKVIHNSDIYNKHDNPINQINSNIQNSALSYASFLFHSDNNYLDIVKAAEFLYGLPDSLLNDLNIDNAPIKVETVIKEEMRDRSIADASKDLSMNISSVTMLKDNNVLFKEEEVNFTDEIEIKINFFEKLNSIQRERLNQLNNKMFLRSILLRNPKGDINKFNLNYHPLYSYDLVKLIEKLNENLFIKKISNFPLIEQLEESIFNLSHKGNIIYSLHEFFKINRIKQLFISERNKFIEKYQLNDSISSTLLDESNNVIQNDSEKIQRKKLIKLIKAKLPDPKYDFSISYIEGALNSIFEQLSLEMLEYLVENPKCIFNYIYTETNTKLSAKVKENKLILNSISSEHKSEKSDYSPNNEYFLGNSPRNLLRGMTLYTPSEFEGSDMQMTSTKHKGKKFFADVTKLLSNTKLREHSSSPKSNIKDENKSPPFREHLQRITINDPEKGVSDFFKDKQYNIINTSKVIEEEENDSFFLKTNAKQSHKVLSLINPQSLVIPISKELFPNNNKNNNESNDDSNQNEINEKNKEVMIDQINKEEKSFEQNKEDDVKDCSYIKENKDIDSPFITEHFGDIIKKVSRKSSGFSSINIGVHKLIEKGSKGSKEFNSKNKGFNLNKNTKTTNEGTQKQKEKIITPFTQNQQKKNKLKKLESVQPKETDNVNMKTNVKVIPTNIDSGKVNRNIHPKFIINALLENKYLNQNSQTNLNENKVIVDEDINSIKTKTTNSSNKISSSSYYTEDENSNVISTPIIKQKPSFNTLKDLVFRQKVNSKK